MKRLLLPHQANPIPKLYYNHNILFLKNSINPFKTSTNKWFNPLTAIWWHHKINGFRILKIWLGLLEFLLIWLVRLISIIEAINRESFIRLRKDFKSIRSLSIKGFRTLCLLVRILVFLIRGIIKCQVWLSNLNWHQNLGSVIKIVTLVITQLATWI